MKLYLESSVSLSVLMKVQRFAPLIQCAVVPFLLCSCSNSNITDTILTGPSTISGLVLWLKADNTVTYDGSSNVTTWTDSSTYARSFPVVTATKPVYIPSAQNGKPTIYFDGNAGMGISDPTDGSLDPAHMTIFFCGSIEGNGYGTILAKLTGGGSWSGGYYFVDVADDGIPGDLQFGFDYSLGPRVGGHFESNIASWQIITATNDGTNFRLLNQNHATAVAETASTQSHSNNSADFTIGETKTGVGTYAYGAKMKLSELLIYNSALNQTQREFIVNYLKSKYGL